MSKGNSGNSSGQAPASAKPQNEYNYENGFLRSQRVYDPKMKGYVDNSFSKPNEQGIENQATDYMGTLVNQLPNAVNLSPEAIQGYKDAYTQPQIAALNDSYNQATGQAQSAASARGLTNSVGFGNYTANQLEKNRAQGLADIQANAQMMAYDLPNKILSPYVNQFNLYNAALQGQQASMAQDMDPSFQGSQAGTNAALELQKQALARWQAQQPQSSRGGLAGFFTGGS